MVITNRRTQQLKRVKKMKYIGVILDEGLKRNEHLEFRLLYVKRWRKNTDLCAEPTKNKLLKAKHYYTNQLLRLT
jgi:hypothetical protein